MDITITLTDTEYAALSAVCANPQEWAENAVRERARLAIDEIVAVQVQAMLVDPKVATIPASIDDIVAAATVTEA